MTRRGFLCTLFAPVLARVLPAKAKELVSLNADPTRIDIMHADRFDPTRFPLMDHPAFDGPYPQLDNIGESLTPSVLAYLVTLVEIRYGERALDVGKFHWEISPVQMLAFMTKWPPLPAGRRLTKADGMSVRTFRQIQSDEVYLVAENGTDFGPPVGTPSRALVGSERIVGRIFNIRDPGKIGGYR